MTEKELYLTRVLETALKHDGALSATLREIVGAPMDDAEIDSLEENIFNESRLYRALGKDDARTVLGIWERFKRTDVALQLAQGK